MLVSDGVSLNQFEAFKSGFESEYASVYTASLKGLRRVRGIGSDGNEQWVYADFSIELVLPEQYDAVAIPGGILSTDLLRKNKSVQELLTTFHAAGKPILVSHEARVLLYESGIFPENILVYDDSQSNLESFLHDSCDLVIEGILPRGGSRR